MKDWLRAELERHPGGIDVYARRSTVAVVEQRGGFRLRGERREEGMAVRRRCAGGAPEIHAWSAPLPLPEPLQCEATLPDLAAAGAAWGLCHASTIDTAVATASGIRVEHTRGLVVATLAMDCELGRLARSRLLREAQAIDLAAELAADLQALVEARRLAPAASPRPTPPRLGLDAAVAACILAQLWAAHRRAGSPALPLPPRAELIDDAGADDAPLGAPFDDVGEPTRRLVIAGPAAVSPAELGAIRVSFADPPERDARNLRLIAPPAADGTGSGMDFRALEIERCEPAAGAGMSFRLIGRDAAGAPGRVDVRLDLGGLLAAIAGARGETWWTPGVGAVGSPALMLAIAGGGSARR